MATSGKRLPNRENGRESGGVLHGGVDVGEDGMAAIAEAVYANGDRQVCEVQRLPAWIESDVRNHTNPHQAEDYEAQSHYSNNYKNEKNQKHISDQTRGFFIGKNAQGPSEK